MSDDYCQPDFYRFNSDSIDLIRWIEKSNKKPMSILDLGAGSGILGIELARFFFPQKLVLVELQGDFEAFLKENTRKFLPSSVSSEIVITSFARYRPAQKFDLVVCNPPYYLPGKGEVPQDQKRAFARTFLQDNWSDLLSTIAKSLATRGRAYLVLKRDDKMLGMVQSETRLQGLEVICRELNTVMILELFALDEK